jgi:hypothetical protein
MKRMGLISYEKKDILNLIEYLRGIDNIPQEFTHHLESCCQGAPDVLPVSPPTSVWAIQFHDELSTYYSTYYRAIFIAKKEELPKIQNNDSISTAIVAWRLEQEL